MSEKTNNAESTFDVGTASNCMYKLWEASADNLTREQLKWFASLSGLAERQAQNLADVVEGIGCIVADDKTGSFDSGSPLSTLLFNINQQIETISGLVHVSSNAYDRLVDPEIYERFKKMRETPDKA